MCWAEGATAITELRMVMQSVALADPDYSGDRYGRRRAGAHQSELSPHQREKSGRRRRCSFWRTAASTAADSPSRWRSGIPVCAGTGGGSSDAASRFLRGLQPLSSVPGYSGEALARLGERVGSDVPYCVLGGTVFAGRGEWGSHPTPGAAAVPRRPLRKPAFSISTPELFARVDGVKLRHPPGWPRGMVVAFGGRRPGRRGPADVQHL
ncbi:MAG: hypothetical protein ACLSAF_20085 [Intestinimonas sp.]